MESATLFAKRIVNERRAQGLPVYDGGLGENPLSPPDELCEELKINVEDKGYKPIDGIPKLRESILEYYETTVYHPKSCVVGNGLKELLFIAQMAFAGKIILISPYWVSYGKHSDILNNDPFVFKTNLEDGYKINMVNFEMEISKIKGPKMLIFNNPNNPTGVVHTSNEVRQLADICRKHNVTVLTDEIYLDLVHNGYEIESISEFYPEGTIIGSSISKQYSCGGYRLGWIVFPEELSDFSNKMKSFSSSIYSCAPSPMHHVGIKALNPTDDLLEYIERSRKLFTEIGQDISEIFRKNSKIKFANPEAAWYLFLDFSLYMDSLLTLGVKEDNELQKLLIEKLGFVGVPGSSFGVDSGNLCMRYSYVDLNKDGTYPNIIEGITKLCNFMESI